MERIDAEQARDHIEMVQRILDESQQRLCAGGEYFVVWGLFSGFVTILFHLVSEGVWPSSALWAGVAALVACVVFSLARGRATKAEMRRRSLLQREFFNVLWLTLGLAFVANVAAFNLFPGIASAAIWSFAETIVLFYIGLHGNRRAQICGILVLVSMVAANFAGRELTAYLLAAGMIAGYAGFGIAETLSHE